MANLNYKVREKTDKKGRKYLTIDADALKFGVEIEIPKGSSKFTMSRFITDKSETLVYIAFE